MRALLVALLIATLALSACGRRGLPSQPEDSVYPRQYPEIKPPVSNRSESDWK